MSFYRSMLAAVAAIAIASPVFADDTTTGTTDQGTTSSMTTSDTSSSTNSTQATKVNINTATLKDLKKVHGLSNSDARKIIAYRKEHGTIKSLDELKSDNIHGLKTLKQTTLDQLTVE